MFSVDNFYSYIRSKYGFDKTGTFLWAFNKHGEKSILNLEPYHGHTSGNSSECWIYGACALHDQEPFSIDLLTTYRLGKHQQQNHDTWLHMQPDEAFMHRLHTCSWPIICHSEKNSADIKYLEASGFIGCYYFYHGMIARDWFRHWKHYPDLGFDANKPIRFLLYARDHTGSRVYRAQLSQQLSDVSISYNPDRNSTSEYSARISLEDAKDTHLHIVAETLFETEKVHLTEKIFKPMVMKQPFVLCGPPGSLEYLKSYGFQTFGDLWDESYDLETDHQLRLEKIIKLIQYLDRLPQAEFLSLVKKAQQVIDHNHRRFFSQEFEDELLIELDHNLTSAISKQKVLLDSDPGGSFFYLVDSLMKRNLELPKRLYDENLVPLIRELKNREPLRFSKALEKYPWLADV